MSVPPPETQSPPSTPGGDPRTITVTIKSVRKWLTGWMVTTIIVPAALLVVGLVVAGYWNRPQLSISIAKGLVGSHRVLRKDGVHEYRAVQDLQARCLTWMVEHSADSEAILPPPLSPVVPKMVYGVYLENVGRSELSDIRLTFTSNVGEFQVTASPQLAVSSSNQLDPTGDSIITVTIASMAPGSRGVIVAALPVNEGRFAVELTSADKFTIDYSLGDADRAPGTNRHFRFAGTRQLSQTPVQSISVDELFTRQKEAFGLESVSLPIDPIEFSASGGNARMRGPFAECPVSSKCGCYTVPVLRRANLDSQVSGTDTTATPAVGKRSGVRSARPTG